MNNKKIVAVVPLMRVGIIMHIIGVMIGIPYIVGNVFLIIAAFKLPNTLKSVKPFLFVSIILFGVGIWPVWGSFIEGRALVFLIEGIWLTLLLQMMVEMNASSEQRSFRDEIVMCYLLLSVPLAFTLNVPGETEDLLRMFVNLLAIIIYVLVYKKLGDGLQKE